jgi:hypothetical protein
VFPESFILNVLALIKTSQGSHRLSLHGRPTRGRVASQRVPRGKAEKQTQHGGEL